MRPDMARVIVGRPRRKNESGAKKVHKSRWDQAVVQEGMHAPHTRNYLGKSLNENLAPLRRFLVSCVGRPWNDVYSEICQHIRVTSTVQEHVRGHVSDFVEINTTVDNDGEIWTHGYRPSRLSTDTHSELYVDPITGILCLNPNYRSCNQRSRERAVAYRAKQALTQRSLPNGVELRQMDGIWYQVELREIPQRVAVTRVTPEGREFQDYIGGVAYDVILGVTLYREGGRVSDVHRNYYRSFMYAAAKRQLGHADLKRYGVSNT